MMTTGQGKAQFLLFLRLLFTGKDNQTPDLGRLLVFLVIFFYIALEVYDVYFTHTFECKDWAEGAGYILFGSGMQLYLKKATEP